MLGADISCSPFQTCPCLRPKREEHHLARDGGMLASPGGAPRAFRAAKATAPQIPVEEGHMLTTEENELITRTGPGTPGGDLLRRYWQPVALEEDLPLDGPPQPVRLLGEDLVLFRDEQGKPGLLGI